MATTDAPQLVKRNCPVCGAAAASSTLFLARRIHEGGLSAYTYSSRKEPEFMRYKLQHCECCDVVFAGEVPERLRLDEAYHEAAYDSHVEAEQAADSYTDALAPLLLRFPGRQGVLDIGTGTGVFLQRMVANGFTEPAGIEPSEAAVMAANTSIRSRIRLGIFHGNEFPPESFDLVTCFMTLEHVQTPREVVHRAAALLRHGGMFAAVVHDWRAWNNRLLGARSPIIDIEHLQLFSRRSATQLLEGAGLNVVHTGSFRNSYHLAYWNRLLPLPAILKRIVAAGLRLTSLDRVRVSLNVGNLLLVGIKR